MKNATVLVLVLALCLGVTLVCGGMAFAQEGWYWQNPLPQGNTLTAVSFTDANTGTAVGRGGTILHTTNGGATWVSQSSGTTEYLLGVSFTDANTGTVVGAKHFGGPFTLTILRTTDGGATWVSQSSGTTGWLEDVSFTDTNTGTAVGSGGTILRTTDGGATWVSQSSGTTLWLNGVSFTDTNTGTVVGSGGTILRTTTGGVVTSVKDNKETSIPVQFALTQNYPNPFNPSTTIEFALPHAGFLTLMVYNLLGEEVATLIAGDHAAGTSRATWNASGHPSGVYFYRLTAGKYVQTKKAVLMK